MKAIVTGASSGIGKSISMALLKEGYEVYGFGRDFSSCEIHNPLFHAFAGDLLVTDDVLKKLNEMKLTDLFLLINNAGCAYYGLHETLSTNQIQEMTRVNLEVPMILTNALLKYIRKTKGTIINIASISGTMAAPHGATYGATKAGLIAFSKSLFDENRKYGVKVSCIVPDMTDTNLYRNADFQADKSDGACLTSEDVKDAILFVLHSKSHMVCNEIVLRPQFHRIAKKY